MAHFIGEIAALAVGIAGGIVLGTVAAVGIVKGAASEAIGRRFRR